MSSNIIRINGVEVASEPSTPTVINIHINQPSGFASLVESAKKAWKEKSPSAQDAGKAPASSVRGEEKVLGAVQIMIGLLCISIAVMICFVQEGIIFFTGSGFWTGVPFILAGAVSIIAEKRGSVCWRSSALLMNLASLAVAIAGIVMVVQDFTWYPWYRWSPYYLCGREGDGYYAGSYHPTQGPTDWRKEECMTVLYKLMYVFNGMRIMLLVATSLALCIALWALGYGCKNLCCIMASQQEEDVVVVGNDKEPLLASHPPQSPEKLPKVETV